MNWTHGAAGGGWGQCMVLLRGLLQGLRRGAAVRELRRLDDRTLRDLGLQRSQLREVAAAMLEQAPAPAPHETARVFSGPFAGGRRARRRGLRRAA